MLRHSRQNIPASTIGHSSRSFAAIPAPLLLLPLRPPSSTRCLLTDPPTTADCNGPICCTYPAVFSLVSFCGASLAAIPLGRGLRGSAYGGRGAHARFGRLPAGRGRLLALIWRQPAPEPLCLGLCILVFVGGVGVTAVLISLLRNETTVYLDLNPQRGSHLAKKSIGSAPQHNNMLSHDIQILIETGGLYEQDEVLFAGKAEQCVVDFAK